MGIRPLCFGQLKSGDGWAFASESCALGAMTANFARDVYPGEIISVTTSGLSFARYPSYTKTAFCAFEYIYFSHPDSRLANRPVNSVRLALGMQLAREHPIEADLGIFVPKTAYFAATGYCDQVGIPLLRIPDHDSVIGRTFLYPNQIERQNAVKQKFGGLLPKVTGKRIVLIDDSLVRGNVMKAFVGTLRRVGARKIYVLIASPPIKYPCYFGVDMVQEELIASKISNAEIAQFLEADSLDYLSQEGMVQAIGLEDNSLCMACFLGNYPQFISAIHDKFGNSQE